MKITSRTDFILLLLYSKGKSDSFNEPILGRLKLAKALFLLKEYTIDLLKWNRNLPYDALFYPEYPKEAYTDIEVFLCMDFVESEEIDDIPIQEETDAIDELEDSLGISYGVTNLEEFKLTSKGEFYTAELFKNLTTDQSSELRRFKQYIVDEPLRAILMKIKLTGNGRW